MVNATIKAVNKIELNRFPFFEMEKMEADYEIERFEGYEDIKVDPEKGWRIGEALNDPVGTMSPATQG
ncbi:hypothetical protein [Halalkalicoccus ordinarius]|uniref:hypothetical protein n=1 Tax=Halalkalicoccus ordinarius TaxID=3116651 RepID=UPI00300F4E3B